MAKLARWLVEEGIVKSSPLAGRGTGEAGGGGAPHSASPAESPLHHASGAVPLPVNGEDWAALAERAARLAKADLVTGMVGEFPELQGLMGGYYAAAQGEPPEVAEAIRDHYKPVGQGDDVPTAPVTVAIAIAERIDILAQFFGHDLKPSGSKDPFALRRAALTLLQLIFANDIRVRIFGVFTRQMDIYQGRVRELVSDEIVGFLIDRLKVQQREAGVRHDLIDAVFALGGEDDLVRLLARVKALQAFITTEDGANLLAGYKRAANILKKEGWDSPSPLVGEGRGPLASASGKGEGDVSSPTPPHPSATASLPPSPTRGEGNKSLSYTPENEEAALIAALDSAAPAAADAVQREDFEGAMAALASLRAPIDAFFDKVTVNDADPAKRTARLALLARVRDAVHGVADFSKIEG